MKQYNFLTYSTNRWNTFYSIHELEEHIRFNWGVQPLQIRYVENYKEDGETINYTNIDLTNKFGEIFARIGYFKIVELD